MGILRSVKKAIVKRSMDKRKKENPFDINAADNFVMPSGAPSRFNDSHYFTMHNFETKECLFFRSARRGGNDTDEIWLFIKTADGRIYLPKDDHIAKGEVNPTKVETVDAGKTLKFYYDGEVCEAEIRSDGSVHKKVDNQPKKLVMEGVFSATTEPFEFSQHMASETMARAVSREKFNKSFKETMSAIHQVHYEQGGTADATFTVGGKTTKLNNFVCIRDHSYGHRDWTFFDRYVWTIIALEDGSFIHTSLMRYPALKNLQAGFDIRSDGKTVSLLYSSELDELPAEGITPPQFSLTAHYVDGTTKHITAKREYYVPFYFDGDFVVNEGVCEYDVDGKKGRGIGEFGFNNDKTKWAK